MCPECPASLVARARRAGVPNDILRSALFAAIQGKGREYFKHKLLASYDGVQIRYTGEQLDQSDLDVWEQAIPHSIEFSGSLLDFGC